MPQDVPAWPVKTRDIHNSIFESRIWDQLDFRPDDIIIATWAKSGTTWMQQILGQLIFAGQENLPIAELSPWLDFVAPPMEAGLPRVKAQTHRRFIKTHLPLDALTFSPKAKYIYVGRDGRDVVWSMHNHHINFVPGFYEHCKNNPRNGSDPGPILEPPTPDVVRYFREWLYWNGYPWWPFWENVRGWWDARHLPNVLLVHFANLKADLDGEMRRISAFLDIPIDEMRWPAIVEHCTFDYMKAHAQYSAPNGGAHWEGGAATFINKGANGRWTEALTRADIQAYEKRALAELGEDCARWLATGERPSGD